MKSIALFQSRQELVGVYTKQLVVSLTHFSSQAGKLRGLAQLVVMELLFENYTERFLLEFTAGCCFLGRSTDK